MRVGGEWRKNECKSGRGWRRRSHAEEAHVILFIPCLSSLFSGDERRRMALPNKSLVKSLH